jgi:hypothetical protein
MESHCKRKSDPKLDFDPMLHEIVRPFGQPWHRHFIIRERVSGKICAWPETSLVGAQAAKAVQELWEGVKKADPHDTTAPEDRCYRHKEDVQRCQFCAVPPLHKQFSGSIGHSQTEAAGRHSDINSRDFPDTPAHENFCMHRDVHINIDSTEAKVVHKHKMTVHAKRLPRLATKGGTQLENVASQVVLGHEVTADGSTRASAEHRISKARQSFNSYLPVLLSQKVEARYKIIVYKAVVYLSLGWGSECWCMGDSASLVNDFNHKCLAAMFHKTLTFSEIVANPPVDIVTFILKKQTKYVGHILRSQANHATMRTMISSFAAVPGTIATRPPHGHTDRKTLYNPIPPSVRYPKAAMYARKPEYKVVYGENPEDVDFVIDRTQKGFRTSIFSLFPCTNFADLFDAANDKDVWKGFENRIERKRSGKTKKKGK